MALSIDAMLPALGTMAEDLGAASPNDRQLVISALFLGLAVGQIIYGPVSDTIGRKPAMFIGLALFIIGSLLSALATSFSALLAFRALEGFGAAGPRIVAVAMVRDLYEGRMMARIMSLAMTIFILVPVFAPAVGQGVLLFFSWRAIFLVLMALAAAGLLWCALRQPETLPAPFRKPFSPTAIKAAFHEILTHRKVMGYILATSAIFSPFVAYLATSQQVFVDLYDQGEMFPLWFGLMAVAIGAASLTNARLVVRLGMRRLSFWALVAAIAISAAFAGLCLAYAGKPPFATFVIAYAALFFAIGMLFGNFNSLALEPMGHIAGTASAVVGSLATLISAGCGALIALTFDMSITPLTLCFAACTGLALAFMAWAENGSFG